MGLILSVRNDAFVVQFKYQHRDEIMIDAFVICSAGFVGGYPDAMPDFEQPHYPFSLRIVGKNIHFLPM